MEPLVFAIPILFVCAPSDWLPPAVRTVALFGTTITTYGVLRLYNIRSLNLDFLWLVADV
jgi:hypothetical protein